MLLKPIAFVTMKLATMLVEVLCLFDFWNSFLQNILKQEIHLYCICYFTARYSKFGAIYYTLIIKLRRGHLIYELFLILASFCLCLFCCVLLFCRWLTVLAISAPNCFCWTYVRPHPAYFEHRIYYIYVWKSHFDVHFF